MAAAPVPSFAEIQKADQEEMKRNEKMLAKQIEAQKAAAVKTNSQVFLTSLFFLLNHFYRACQAGPVSSAAKTVRPRSTFNQSRQLSPPRKRLEQSKNHQHHHQQQQH